MLRILLLGLRDPHRRLEEELRRLATKERLEVDAAEPGRGNEWARNAPELDTLVIDGRAESAAGIARHAARVAPRLAVILLCPEAELEVLANSLRLTPGIGPDVRCLAESGEGLAGAVVEAAEATSRRRALRRSLAAMSERLDRSSPLPPVFASSHFVDRLLDRLPLGVAVADSRGRLAALNPSAEGLLKCSEKDALGRRLTDLLPSGAREDARALERLVVPGDTLEDSVHEDEIDLRLDDRILSVRASRVSMPHDGLATLLLLEDVTSRRRMEAQLRQMAKHEALGRLSGGVAHHFNNLLTVILFHAEELTSGEAGLEAVAEISRAAERAAELTRQLVAFGGRQLARKGRLDLVALVHDLAPLLERSLDKSIRLDLRDSGEPLPISVDRGQVEQVLVSLAFNARDAMPEGGVLALELGRAEIGSATEDRPGLRSGRYALLVVRDTGCGMEEEVRERAFEPFFTTKEVGEGTGLGLAAAYGIVRQNRGRIYVESEPGEGTAVFLYLPLVRTEEVGEETDEEAENEDSAPRRPRGSLPAVDRGEDPR